MPPPLPFFFFFKGSGAPGDLPSFPTRRSSDLRAVSAIGSPRPSWMSREERNRACPPSWYVPTSKETRVRDRKSTRLNSSHGYISYAVFCLKKKKIHVDPIHP